MIIIWNLIYILCDMLGISEFWYNIYLWNLSRITEFFFYEMYDVKLLFSFWMTFALYLQTETALIYDAVYLFARGLHGVEKAKNMNFRQGIMCNSSTSWEDGLSLLNYMKTVCSKAKN